MMGRRGTARTQPHGLVAIAICTGLAAPAAGQDQPATEPSIEELLSSGASVNERLREMMESVEARMEGIPGSPEDATEGLEAEPPAAPGEPPAPEGAAEPPPEPAEEAFDGEVIVDEFDLVDLHVQSEDLGQVLQLLSLQSRRNIVASPNVSATITADLYGVTFYEALDAILHINGFGYREQGSFIYVYTLAELEALAQATRRLETRVVPLNYLNAVDAARFAAPLLSDVGTMTTPNESPDFLLPEVGPTGKDDYANAAMVVIHDYPENIEEIVGLIGELDTRPSQVLVEATILQATINEENAFGIDFALIGDLDFIDLANPLAPVTALLDGEGADGPVPGADGEGRGVVSTPGNAGGKGTLKAGIVDEDIAVFLRVLDEVTDVTVISNPKVLALNRQPARVLVGTRVGFLNTTITETATTQSVEFLDTGTQLLIRPFVTTDELIRLEVKPQVSTASLRETSTSNGLPVTIPDEDTTEVVTNLLVRDGQTVVIGGLFTETTQYTRRQVPVVGDIPLIGAAFRGQDDNISRSEIIFLITPTLVNDALLTLEGERATDYVEHARVGAREGLLPWSRDRQVGQLLIEAEEAARAGDRRVALLKVQRALSLAPHSPDAMALRERLTNDRAVWPSRSILDDVMRREPDAGAVPPPPPAEPEPID